VVKTLELKEGDEIEINVTGDRIFEVSRDPRRLEALEMIRQLRRPLPPGYKFNRAELYDHEVLKSSEPVEA
jgi:antitoxin MazE